MYYYLRKNIKTEYFILFTVLFFVAFYLFNKLSLKVQIIKINRVNNRYRLPDGAVHRMDVRKSVVLYEYAGETLVNAIGNLYLKFNNSEYPLYYSANESEINEIKSSLEAFFLEPLLIEQKKLP